METIIMALISPLLLPAILAAGFAIMTGQKPEAFIRPLVKIYFSILKTLLGLVLTSIKLLWSRSYKAHLDNGDSPFERQDYQAERYNSGIRIKVLDE